jgi:hypothetical protein
MATRSIVIVTKRQDKPMRGTLEHRIAGRTWEKYPGRNPASARPWSSGSGPGPLRAQAQEHARSGDTNAQIASSASLPRRTSRLAARTAVGSRVLVIAGIRRQILPAASIC